jgi:transposase
MAKSNVIAIDIAKNIFQVCSVNKSQKVEFNKTVKRAEIAAFIAQQPTTTIVMEACYTSHYWGRVFKEMGHKVRLIPAQFVKPFVRGHKSDRNDAVAIAEASFRPDISSVAVKTVEQQDIQVLHRIRDRYVARRTGLVNQCRGLLAEYGIIAPQGLAPFCRLLREVTAPDSRSLSRLVKTEFAQAVDEYNWLTDRITELNERLAKIAKANEVCKILLSIPGIGAINATALYSAIGRGQQFKSARELAVWLGLTPKQSSSGERFNSGGITKRGNSYLRKQLVHGARSALARCRGKDDALSRWGLALIERRGVNKACVAMAARMARLAWTLINRNEMYKLTV